MIIRARLLHPLVERPLTVGNGGLHQGQEEWVRPLGRLLNSG